MWQKFKLKWGLRILNPGIPVIDDNFVIDGTVRYKDIYLEVLKGDNGYSVGWSYVLSPHTLVRELWTAEPPETLSSNKGSVKGENTDVKR